MLTEIITIDSRASVRQAMAVLVENRISGAPVVGEGQRIVGFVSEYDLILAVHSIGDGSEVSHAMKTHVLSIREETPIEEIAALMLERNIRRVPVVGAEGHLVGIVSRRDVLRTYYFGAASAGAGPA
jgi:CBS domain-containing protein